METVIDLNQDEAIKKPEKTLGFIGWDEFGKNFQQLLADHQRPIAQQGWIYPLTLHEKETQTTGWSFTSDLDTLFHQSNIIFVVAPYEQIKPLLPRIRLLMTDQHILVLMRNDVSFHQMDQEINPHKLIRCVMSKIHAISDMILAFTFSDRLSPEETDTFHSLVHDFSYTIEARSESHLQAVQAVISTGITMGFTLIDALADGALKMGIPKRDAQKIAAFALWGATKTFLETGTHPAILRDQEIANHVNVMEGIQILERSGIRGMLMECIERAGTDIPSSKSS